MSTATTAPATKAELIAAIKASAAGGDYTASALKKKSLAALESLWAEVQKPSKVAAPRAVQPLTVDQALTLAGAGHGSVAMAKAVRPLVNNDGQAKATKERDGVADALAHLRDVQKVMTAVSYHRDPVALAATLDALKTTCDAALAALLPCGGCDNGDHCGGCTCCPAA